MKFPQIYLKTLLRTYPEIENVEIIQHIEQLSTSPFYNETYTFLIMVNINIKQGCDPIGNSIKYEENMSTLFKMIFPDNDNICFKVERLNVPRKIHPHSLEAFYELFQ